jgi:hypothetical protein
MLNELDKIEAKLPRKTELLEKWDDDIDMIDGNDYDTDPMYDYDDERYLSYINPNPSYDESVDDELIQEMVCSVLINMTGNNPSHMSIDNKEALDDVVLAFMLPPDTVEDNIQDLIRDIIHAPNVKELVLEEMSKCPEACVALRSWYQHIWKGLGSNCR